MAKFTDEKIKKFDENLAVFPLSLLQDFITFKVHCKKMGIDEEDVIEYIKINVQADVQEKREQIKFDMLLAEKSPSCSVCKSTMMLEPVNNHPARMVDDHSNTWWVCPDPECTSDPILSDKYPNEIMSDLGIPIHKQKFSVPTRSARRKRAASRQRQTSVKGDRR